ncbi:7436_t:CDS:2, partial [Acaulospora colombiana]
MSLAGLTFWPPDQTYLISCKGGWVRLASGAKRREKKKATNIANTVIPPPLQPKRELKPDEIRVVQARDDKSRDSNRRIPCGCPITYFLNREVLREEEEDQIRSCGESDNFRVLGEDK